MSRGNRDQMKVIRTQNMEFKVGKIYDVTKVIYHLRGEEAEIRNNIGFAICINRYPTRGIHFHEGDRIKVIKKRPGMVLLERFV